MEAKSPRVGRSSLPASHKMKSEYRGILAIGLSAAFFILWYVVVSPPQKGAPAAEQAPASVETTASPAPAAPVESSPAQSIPK